MTLDSSVGCRSSEILDRNRNVTCCFASSTKPSSATPSRCRRRSSRCGWRPPSDEDQTNLGYRLRIVPSAPVTIYRDGFGNRVDLFNIITPYSELIIRATSIVRTHRGDRARIAADATWRGSARPAEPMAIESLEYLQPSPLVKPCPELDAVHRRA